MASLVLVVYTVARPEMDFIHDPRGLLLRVLLFGGLSVVAGLVLWRARLCNARSIGPAPPEALSTGAKAFLAALVLIVALLLGFRLADYPWAAPDEVHHLVVARNIAIHGVYASGHPDSGFRYFDSFDSVGPVVLGPIALAFKVLGVHLAVARGVMVAFYIGLSVATFFFTRSLFGIRAGLVSMGLLLGTYSSIYLGRTLYGEVPAYFFLLLGMMAWRRALWAGRNTSPARWGLLAGALVACAMLSKTILVLVAFSFLGVWVYDRVTWRRIGWRAVVFPCVGGFCVLGLWALFQRLHGTAVTESGGVLAIYQHYLLFGVSSVRNAFEHAVLPHPLAHLAWLGVLIATFPMLFARRYDPPAMVLYLYAIFLLYWWFFFTPGHLHRYLWNAYAILALFAAPCLLQAWQFAFRPGAAFRRRAIAMAVVVVLVWPGMQWTILQAREIATNDEMAPEYALIDVVRSLPDSTRVATDVDRLPGLLNFFEGRLVSAGRDPVALLRQFDVVISRDTPVLRASLPPGCVVQPAGGFVLLSTPQRTE